MGIKDIAYKANQLTNEKADEHLVVHVGLSMTSKLAKKRDDGCCGWQKFNGCTNKQLLESLRKHVEKGDMIDVINIAGMIDARTNMYGDKA